jgi:hypothetical protein
LAAALLSVATVALADRRRNPAEIAVVLVGSQPILHLLMSMGGHGEAVGLVPGPAMVLGHLVAAVILTVVLSGGEAVVWALAALSNTVLFPGLCALRNLVAPTSAIRVPPTLPNLTRISYAAFVGDSVPRRGPPLG